MAVELASAYISLVPSFKGGSAAIAKGLGGAKAGQQAGQAAGKGFLGGLGPMVKRAAGVIGLALGGAAVIGGIKNSIGAAAELETKFREVVTLFGETGNVADKSFSIVKGQVRDLSNQFGIAQETLTGGLYQAISAGVPRENAFTFMQVASQAAIGGVTEVETAVDGITTVINAFGLEAADAQAVSDSMFTAVKGGKTNFEELSASLFNVAPAAAAANVSMEEVNAAIATLTAGGTPTSVATTQIRAALTGLQKPSKDLDAIFQSLGYENAQLAIESEGLGFALSAVKDASGGNNGELQKLLGSTEAVAAANVLAGTGAEKFNEELENQANAAGATSDAFGEVNKSAARQFEVFKNQVRNIGISIGQALLPALTAVTGALSKWLPVVVQAGQELGAKLAPAFRQVGDFISTSALPALKSFGEFLTRSVVPALIEVGRSILSIILPPLKQLGQFMISTVLPALSQFGQFVGGTIVPALRGLAGWLQSNEGWLRPIAAGILAIVVAMKAWTLATTVWSAVTKAAATVQAALNAVLAANPIGIVVLALVALVAALTYAWQNSETFRDVVKSVWEAIQSAVGSAWDWIKKNVVDKLIAAWGAIESASGAVRDALTSAWNAVRDALGAAWDWIKKNVVDKLVAAFQWVGERAVAVRDTTVAAWNAIRDGLGAAWDWVKTNVIERFISGFQSVWNKATDVRDGVVGAWQTMRDKLVEVWEWIRDKVFTPVKDGFDSVWTKAKDIKDKVVEAFSTVAETIESAFTGITDGIKTALNWVFGKINTWMISPLNKILAPFDLEIPKLPELHTGGLVPGQGEKPYMLLGGEAVLNPMATKALGPEVVNALNRGEGFGGLGWPDWLDWDNAKLLLTQGAKVGTGQNLGDGLLLSLEKAVEWGMDKLRNLSWGPDVPRVTSVGATEDMAMAALDWARGNDEKVKDTHGKNFGTLGLPDMSGSLAFPLPRGSYRVGVGINGYPGHTGQDFPAPVGTAVFAPFAGQASQINLGNRSYGRYVSLLGGGGMQFIGAHLSAAGKAGAVSKGDLIGRVGSTGNSTGPHLHAEFRRFGRVLDPRSMLTFDSGGYLPQGHSLVYNGTGGPERVLDRAETKAYERGAGVNINMYGSLHEQALEIERKLRQRQRAKRGVG